MFRLIDVSICGVFSFVFSFSFFDLFDFDLLDFDFDFLRFRVSDFDLFDLNWMNIPFSTTYRIIQVDYKEHKSFDVYIRKKDMPEAVYLCTTSKVRRTNQSSTLISSRICSRLDGEPA